MKKLLISLIVIVILLGAAAAYVVSNLSLLVARFQPDIEKQISQQLGVPVSLGELDVSVFPKTKFSTKKISVGDGISVASISAEVSLSELLHKKLSIKSLSIVEPVIFVEKTSEGFQVRGLPRPSKKPKEPRSTEGADSENVKSVVKSPDGESKEPLSLELSSFSVTGGRVSVLGLLKDAPLVVKDLDFSTSLTATATSVVANEVRLAGNIEGVTPFSAKIPSATLEGVKASIPDLAFTILDQAIKATANVDTAQQVGAVNIEVPAFDISQLSRLSVLVPALKSIPLTGIVTAKLSAALAGKALPGLKGEVKIQDVSAALPTVKVDKVTGTVAVNGNVKDLSIQSPSISLDLNDQPVTVGLDGQVVGESAIVKTLGVRAFGGTVKTQGTSQFDLSALSIGTTIQALQIPDLMKAFAPSAPQLTGKIDSVTAVLKTGPVREGTSNSDLGHRLTGPVSVSVSEITVPKLQIIQPIIRALEAIPSLGAMGMNGATLIPQQTAALQAGETRFSTIVATTSLDGTGNLILQDLTGEAGIFTLHGRGRATVAGQLALQSEIILSDALSTYLTSRTPGLKYAEGLDGRITVPVQIDKSGDSFVVTPNVQKIVETAAARGLAEQASKALNKTLGAKFGGTLGGFLKGGLLK